MADTGRTVFADGFFADGFWAVDFFAADLPVTVPDVVGETQAAGTATLEGAGFVVAVETAYSSTVPAGEIISQAPAGGADAAPGSTVTITVSLGDAPASQGAGKSRRKRYFVHVGGQDFEVSSPEAAKEVLQKAAALAERAAEHQAAARVVKAQPVKVKPVKLTPPRVTTNAPIDITPYREAIERAYRNAAAAAEIRLLLDAQLREDDETAAYLLLH